MENERLKKGEDIHMKWTATSGNVSLPNLVVLSHRIRYRLLTTTLKDVALGNTSALSIITELCIAKLITATALIRTHCTLKRTAMSLAKRSQKT